MNVRGRGNEDSEDVVICKVTIESEGILAREERVGQNRNDATERNDMEENTEQRPYLLISCGRGQK